MKKTKTRSRFSGGVYLINIFLLKALPEISFVLTVLHLSYHHLFFQNLLPAQT